MLRALWSLAAEGWATNDSFAPMRLMAGAPEVEQAIAAPPDRKLSRLRCGSAGAAQVQPRRKVGGD